MNETETTQPDYVEGFSLRGEEVANSKHLEFEILNIPEYEEFTDKDTKEIKRRMKLRISFNKTAVDYYPNKTSQFKIIAKRGRDLSKWVGFKGIFETMTQKVGSETKEVIYIK